LDFSELLWYNNSMDNKNDFGTSNTEMVTISRAEYESLQSENAELTQRIDWLMEQLRLVRKKKFGSSSEKATEETYEQMTLLFDEAEGYAYAEEQKAEEAKEETTSVAGYERKKKSGSVRDVVPKDIPTQVVEHKLPQEELVCPECGSEMTVIGKEVKETLVFQPAKAFLRQDVYYTYACRNCDKENIETPIVKAPKEPSLIPGGFASPEAVAHIMTQKFVMHSPLYRQEQEWNRQGIQISRQTMSNWVIRCAEDWLSPIYDALKERLLTHDVLHADETTLQVLNIPGKTAQSKSYMWLYRTSGDAEHPIVLYEYQPDRKAEHPKEFLAGFKGYLHTDGYAGYHNLGSEITIVGCWAHARRKFDEAVKSLPKGKQKGSNAQIGQAYCSKLFELERQLQALSPKERYEKRLELEKPVLDALSAWLETRNAAPKSALGKALHYLREQWPYLINYLKDGRLELSNNRAERSIKPFVISRKNFLFANTPKGAQSSAIVFSLIETAKENGLDPYRYLVHILSQAPKLSLQDEDWAEKLLPECVLQH